MMQRFLTAAPPGILITAALLWAMQALIVTDFVPVTPRQLKAPEIFKFTPDEKPVDDIWEPPPINDPVDPPPRPPLQQRYEGGDPISLPHYTQDPAPTGNGTNLTLLPADGPLVHMVRVQPTYPPVAQSQGLEGYVTVRFDVTAMGKATNVSVVESSSRVFESAALRAARKFRFRPKTVDGTAVPVSGIAYRFRFEMDN